MKPNKVIRTKTGAVVSDKMDKTITVTVDRVKKHPLYKKQYKVSKKYKVHDEKNEFKVGDIVEFTQSRPLSRNKKFIALKRV